MEYGLKMAGPNRDSMAHMGKSRAIREDSMPATQPIRYIERTRAYYLALGYDNPYQWAHHDDIPFTPLKQPLSGASVAIVTTAAPYQADKGDQGPGAAYNASAKFYRVYRGSTATMPDLRISHIAIDRAHTSAEDIGTWFPLKALQRAVSGGRVGAVASHFYGLPSNRSQRTTLEQDCADLLAHCRGDGVDAAILVPNCPVCHQSTALAARTLEEAGIATVIMGCALDIVEHAGVPRFVFSDFPLGNSAGRPHDTASQDRTLSLALDLLEGATKPGTIAHSPLIWPGPPDWREDYSNPDRLSPEDLAKRRADFDKIKAVAQQQRDGS